MLNSKSLLKSALLAGAAVVAFTGVAPVQAQEAEKKVEKVTVTGTRIKQRDFTSISPLATVSSAEISLTGTVNTEELINTLPQVIPGVTITSNNPSLNGFATADLRGLGPGRTLVLINGRRANPSSAGGLVDLNTIPASLIDRIEIISGGASAVYGADAVAGAINFILKDNYEGLTVGSFYQQTEDGLAPTWVADALVGGNFNGDRGSIQLAFQYANRQHVDASERGFSRFAPAFLIDNVTGVGYASYNAADLQRGGLGGTGVIANGGSATAPWGSIAGFGALNVTAVFGLQPDANCNPLDGLQTTGTIRFRNGGGIAPFQSCPHPNFDPSGALLADGDRYNFAPDNFLVLGNERVNTIATAKYDILPDGILQAFADAMYTNTRTTQQLAATPATGLIVKYDLDPALGSVVLNPYVASVTNPLQGQPQLFQLAQTAFFAGPPAPSLAGPCVGPFPNPASIGCLDNRSFVLNIRTTQVGNRTGDIETNAFGSTQGFRGVIPSLDWDWEIYHSFARNTTTVKNNNNIGRTAFTQLLNACNTTSVASQPQPLSALPNCVFPHNSAAGGTFVPMPTVNNPLGVFALSPAMMEFIRVNSTDIITYERTMISANATGDVVDLWGEGAISAALGFEYRSEELDNRTDPFKGSGDIIGFNAAESVAGQFDVYELYGEINVPLITEETLAYKLNFVGGYRKSDYSTGAGLTETWKYGGEWAPFEWLTFRAIENHAVRAPSAFELFRAGDQNFPAYVDPCSRTIINALPVASQPARIAVCNTWFASYGSAAFFPAVAPFFQAANSQVQAFLFGNQNLQPEIADTLTYGLVFNPGWWPVGRIALSVDRYEIELDNQIAQRSISQILNGCVAAGGVVVPGNDCDNAPRAALSTGNIVSIDQSLANFTGVSLYTGIDVNLRWSWDWEEDLGLPGTFGIATLYSWVDESNGDQGLYQGSIGGIVAEHKAVTSFSYNLEDWSFLVRYNYLSAVEDNIVGVEHIGAYEIVDFGGRWDICEDLQFSFGVDNVFDEQPPVWGGASIAGQFSTDGSTYEQLGRQYRLGLRWQTD